MATRRERVIVKLDDDFSVPMERCAGATALLNHELNRLSGQAVVSSRFARTVERDMDGVSASTRRASADINQFSGRLSLLLRLLALVGPTAAPLGTVAVAGVAGMASQLGFAATGALSLVAAAQGVGDALKAVNEAAIAPTAANLEKAREAMSKLGPEARAFVNRFQDLRPVLGDIRDSAARGWFPGLTESLDSLEKVAPRIANIFERIGEAGGNLIAEGAEALAGPEWADFLSFVEDNAPQALDELGRTLGNLTKGLAELWMAFDPLNDDFSQWMLRASRNFAKWSEGLSETEGFAEFIDYVRTNGPKLADALGAIGSAILEIGEAAAPLGGPVLDALGSLADAIATIVDSPLGTPIMAAVTAMSALSLATNVATTATLRLKAAQASLGIGGKAAPGAAGGALAGGPLGMAALATLQAGVNTADTFNQAKSGENGLGESLLRALVPAIPTLEAFGVKLPGLTTKTEELAQGTLAAGSAFEEFRTNVEATESPIERLRTNMLAARDAARESAKSFIDFSDSIAGDKFSLSGWLDAFEAQVRALADFRDNIQTLRDKGLNESIIDELIAQGPAAAQAVEGLANAGEGAIKRLNGAAREGREEVRGMGKDAKKAEEDLQNLGNANASPKIDADPTAFDNKRRAVDGDLDRLDKKRPKPSIDLNDGPFQRARQHAANQLNDLTKPRTVTVTAKLNAAAAFATLRSWFGGAPSSGSANAAEKGLNPADGGTIPRFGGRPIRSAAGSTVPDDGGGYRDYLLYMLAPLEEVISNRRGQADRFRPELKDINAGMSRAEVIERMLMRGLVTTPRTAAGGGTAGKQIVSSLAGPGGPRKGDSVLGFFPEVGKSTKELKAWVKSLEESRSTIENELKERQSLADALGESIKNRLTTNPFGDTDPWSAGSTFEDVMAVLTGDTTAARAQTEDIQALRDKGLDGDALTALLADADNETIAAWADLSAEQLDQYERAFQDRALAVADAQTAAMNAAFGAQLASTNARLDQVIAEQQEANRLLAIAPDATGKKAGEQTGKSLKKSAGKGVQGIKGGGR